MSLHTVVLDLPEPLLRRLSHAAERARRPMGDIIVETIAATITSEGVPILALREALVQMAYLNDAALWQAARTTVAAAQRERLELLHFKQQRERLDADEQAEMDALEQLYRDTVLVRAQAAVLLKQRHYDVSDLDQFAPLE